MRYTKLMMLLALAGGLTFATACGGDGKDDTDVVEEDDDDDDETTGTPQVEDTAYVLIAYVGGGTISGAEFTGFESTSFIVTPLSASAYTVCDWTWDGAGPVPSAVATVPCTDDVDNACVFTLDTVLTNGAQTAGDCATYPGYTFGADGGDYTYGHVENYGAYGAGVMYYSRTDSDWFHVGSAEYDATTGEWSYFWPAALYYYY